MFRVAAGSTPKAHWKLDETAGATTLTAVTREGEPAITDLTSGGVTLGVDGQAGTAMRADGASGYAETTAPVIDTTKSYAVASWVKLANTNGFATVMGQDGTIRSAFYLQYVKDDNRSRHA